MEEFKSKPRKIVLNREVFYKIRLRDKEMFEDFMKKTTYPANLWSSAFSYLWTDSQSNYKKIMWKIVDGYLIPFVLLWKSGLHLNCLPFGRGDPEEILSIVYKSLQFCDKLNRRKGGKKATIRTVNAMQLDFLRGCDKFEKYFKWKKITGIERHFGIQNLITLSGKDFSNVRGQINRFKRKYPQAILRRYHPSDYSNLIELNNKWQKTAGKNYSLIFDEVYFREIIRHYKELDHLIQVVEIDGKIVGMITGEILPTGQSWGCLTKKWKSINGLSEMMIVEFAKEIHRLDPNVELINVGSDLGTAGLSHFKEKFRPILNLERYRVTLK